MSSTEEPTEKKPTDEVKEQSSMPSVAELENAIDELDEDLEQAFGRAADSIWGFASSVSNAVRTRQPGLDALRKNVKKRMQPLENIGRDLGSQIGNLAPKEESIASITGSITGSISNVAKSVQRNASAVEAAILSKANSLGSEAGGVDSIERDASKTSNEKPSLPLLNEGVDGLAKVGEKLSNSIVGQTVGGFWDGLWGGDEEFDEVSADGESADGLPRTRFEQRLQELQANPDTYCKPASDMEAFKKWGEEFNLDDVENQCKRILRKHETIADLYVKVVPDMVEENTFWMRYFYSKHVLEVEEERRRKLIEQAETAVENGHDDDDGWGDDDWDDVDDVEETKLKKSTSEKESDVTEDAKSNEVVEQSIAEVVEKAANGQKQEEDAKVEQQPAPGDEDEFAGSTTEKKDSSDAWSDDDDWE